MEVMNAYRVIKRPHTSEKSLSYIEASDTYTFEVDGEATKEDIREAVASIWDVKVKSVRTINVPGKIRRFGKSVGRTRTWKKAIVRLAEGQAIEALK